MHCTLDLRFAIPPLVNTLLYLLLNSQGHLWDWEYQAVATKMTSLILGFLISYFILSFLNLPLSLMLTVPNHQMVGFANLCHFSLPLALALLASFLFPPTPFWYAYLICIGVFLPRWNSIVEMVRGFVHAMPGFSDEAPEEEEETLESVFSSHMEYHELGDEADDDDDYQHDENLEILTMYGHA